VSGKSDAVAVILAAGKGTRMQSDRAKVLFPLQGRPLIHHVLDAVRENDFARILVIVGHQQERVREALDGLELEFVRQEPQLGTGHAMLCAAPLLEGFTGSVVVLAGDAPLLRGETLSSFMDHHLRTGATVTVLTAEVPDPAGYGRIIRNDLGRVVTIVEDKDCRPEQRGVREINSSIYVFCYPFLAAVLPALSNVNRQGEFYLTDTVAMAVDRSERVEGFRVADFREVWGVNTAEQLALAEEALRERNGD
jgi:bifunctional UDP-N-acetylglucosamine pyrophosphorylase/glucosamine-1-phosphate N-acetyltransferase